jgi:hypothetical protein
MLIECSHETVLDSEVTWHRDGAGTRSRDGRATMLGDITLESWGLSI